MRAIVLDTETTGLDALKGDRVVEIGCVELINLIPTGQSYHVYINPERDMPEEAFRVHGLSSEFLADKPLFAHIAEDFARFIAEGDIVIHNAAFDVGFLNAELERVGLPPIGRERVVDTLMLARRRNPAGPNNLDALCARFGIDTSRRVKHGALLDAELLAEVYAELMGGKQTSLLLDPGAQARAAGAGRRQLPPRPEPLGSRLSETERAEHIAFVASLGPHALWRGYLDPAEFEPPADTAA